MRNAFHAALVASLFFVGSAFAKGSTIVVAPLQADKNVPTKVAQDFDNHLRKVAGEQGQVISLGKTGKAMSKGGVSKTCMTAKCGASLTKASAARFALFTSVSNDDDIYKVTMVLYDAAFKKSFGPNDEECELCAADEVNGTLTSLLQKFAKPLAVPAPVVEKPKPEETAGVAVTVKSKPKGVKVSVGGVEKGKTPLTFNLKPGTYKLMLTKEGFLPTSKKINALDRKVSLSVTLKPDPNSTLLAKNPANVKNTKPKTVEDKKPVEQTQQPAEKSLVGQSLEPAGSAYNGLALGMILGGVALSGVGTWLVLLDGEITCSDGRGRRECPNVYNTNGLGLLTFGLGTAAIGAGTALFIEDYVRMSRHSSQVKVGAAPTDGGAFLQMSGEF